jgi:hypothetical protein
MINISIVQHNNMGRFSSLLGAGGPEPKPNKLLTEVPEETSVELLTEVPTRARDDKGHFIADDPTTPENEAWVGGVAPEPAKKKRTRRKKSV